MSGSTLAPIWSFTLGVRNCTLPKSTSSYLFSLRNQLLRHSPLHRSSTVAAPQTVDNRLLFRLRLLHLLHTVPRSPDDRRFDTMKFLSLLSYVLAGKALFGSAVAAADLQDSDPNDVRAASIYIQPVAAATASKPQAPALLAEIRYDVLDPSTAQVVAYEPPEDGAEELGEADLLYRVGIYDPQSKQWLAGTSVAAASNFAKGYSPHFVLTVGPPASVAASWAASSSASWSYLGVSVRGLAIDAGATRDFGPQAMVVVASKGATPVLNRPVVLSPEGKKAEPAEEKTFLQKCARPFLSCFFPTLTFVLQKLTI